jgi:hypothetical protein
VAVEGPAGVRAYRRAVLPKRRLVCREAQCRQRTLLSFEKQSSNMRHKRRRGSAPDHESLS